MSVSRHQRPRPDVTDTQPGALRRYVDDKRQPLLILAAAALTVSAVIGYVELNDDDVPVPVPWSAGPNLTSCEDWQQRMTPPDRDLMASQALHALRSYDGLTPPSDGLVDTFADGIDTACVEPAATVAEMAAGVYLTDGATFAR